MYAAALRLAIPCQHRPIVVLGGCGRFSREPERTEFRVYPDPARAPPRLAPGTEPLPTDAMPSLLRFLAVVGLIGAVIYGGVFALATFVNPKPREISVVVPPDRFYKQR